MNATVSVRALEAADVPALARVLARAYASRQRFDLRLRGYLRMMRVATFVAEQDRRPVGMVVGNDYGSLAYVSQMAVDPDFQRRGIGTCLMDALIAWLDGRGFAATELDATVPGEPLYRRYGFRVTGATISYAGKPGPACGDAVRLYRAADRDAVFAADREAFGADRSDVLALLLRHRQKAVFVAGEGESPDGYAIAQLDVDRLGPLIAPTAAAAARLLDAARARFGGEHSISVPAENATIHALLAARGYRAERSLAHMSRGCPHVAARERIFARINLGQG